MRSRPAWPPDDEMVRDLVGAFPFTDTPDQARTDEEVVEDAPLEDPPADPDEDAGDGEGDDG